MEHSYGTYEPAQKQPLNNGFEEDHQGAIRPKRVHAPNRRGLSGGGEKQQPPPETPSDFWWSVVMQIHLIHLILTQGTKGRSLKDDTTHLSLGNMQSVHNEAFMLFMLKWYQGLVLILHSTYTISAIYILTPMDSLRLGTNGEWVQTGVLSINLIGRCLKFLGVNLSDSIGNIIGIF